MTIAYEIGNCVYGRILAAKTRFGLCAVSLNRTSKHLIEDLKNRFPAYTCEPGDVDLQRVIASIDDTEIHYCDDMHIMGTPFQKRVWLEIQCIPHAHTVTYKWIAEAIGQPKAFRAVAQACGQNPLAVIIPCHRVISKPNSSGNLGGYRWGAEIKHRLLEAEEASLAQL